VAVDEVAVRLRVAVVLLVKAMTVVPLQKTT
jgi:hypothetical protein